METLQDSSSMASFLLNECVQDRNSLMAKVAKACLDTNTDKVGRDDGEGGHGRECECSEVSLGVEVDHITRNSSAAMEAVEDGSELVQDSLQDVIEVSKEIVDDSSVNDSIRKAEDSDDVKSKSVSGCGSDQVRKKIVIF